MLEFRNADAFIGQVPILRGLTLSIAAAETIALIGRNGAGKTTTLRSVMGFTDVRGQILVDGRDITKVKPSRRPALPA